MLIYHISNQTEWDAAQQAGVYQADSLASEGFIHCSTREQILPVALRFYKGRTDLLLLAIETERLSAPVKFENLEGGEILFPHIYGPLNLDAVAARAPFPPQPDGSFQFPAF